MMKLRASLLKEIEKIRWFSNVGLEIEFNSKLHQVKSWRECESYFVSDDWEEVTLEARNNLTQFLRDGNSRAFSEWNALIEEGQDFLKNAVIPVIGGLDLPVDEKAILMSCVRWDLLSCLMEDAYSEFKPPVFFANILEIYKSGHFPCGWQGRWPEGNLVIF